MSGISAGAASFKLSFVLSPLVLTGGLASNIPGGALPALALSQAISFTGGLLNPGEPLGLDDYFAQFQPLPGSDIFRNPEKWGIEFEYDSNPMWYRGKPGEYQPTMRTKELSTQDIIELRDSMERKYGNHTVHQEVK